MKKTILLTILAASCGSLTLVNIACAQGTAFTYQGQLENGGNPANGFFDLTFSLYNSSSGGSQFGGTLTNTAVRVTNGLFTVAMDFGSMFNGTPYWLQVGVRTNGVDAFSALTPRSELTPTPYAVYAESAGSSALVSDPGTENFFAGQLAGSQTLIGTHNTGVGYSALDSITTGVYNTAFGDSALLYDTAGSDNTAYGVYALKHNTSGGNNTALGADVLASNTSGDDNTGVGLGAMESNTSGSNNIAIGNQALVNNTTGANNVAEGFQALYNNSTGSQNTANGYNALNNNVSGTDNTAVGWLALMSSTGNYNTALGASALMSNTTASYNTACGYEAMAGPIFGGITTGGYNSAYGAQALAFDSTGTNNTAVGVDALEGATSPDNNTANGAYALGGNLVTGSSDTGIGSYALFDLTTGYNNVAAGYQALYANSSGFDNVGIGVEAFLANAGSQNTAVGTYAFQLTTSGSGNIGLGYTAGKNLTSGNNNIYIGNLGNSSESGIIRIGTPGTQTLTYIAGTIENPSCNNLTITGGSDLAEPFTITATAEPVPEGAVVVIDEAHPGQLKLADQPYDTRVAGVVSGANGIHPGIQMHQEGVLEGGKNVALSGRVYVQADTSNGAINPGDLLTTSATLGHAMKVSDHARAAGAILGKAMTALNAGQGMVLVLVSLQ